MSLRGPIAASLAALTIAVALLVPAAPSDARLAPAELQCRSTLSRQTRRYLQNVHRVRQRCLHKIYTGKISPLIDCIGEEIPGTNQIGTGDEVATARIETLRSEVGSMLQRKCGLADLATLGFPGGCDAGSDGFDLPDLETCVIETLDKQISQMLRVETPPVGYLPPRVLSCVTGVGRHGASMIRKEVRARERCLLAIDQGLVFDDALTCRDDLPPYGEGTGSDNYDGKILDSYIDLLAGVPSVCKTTNVGKVGFGDHCEDTTGGRFTTFDLKLCVFDDHREACDEVLDTAFPSPPECGDGDVEGDEECDDGNELQTDSCLNDCTEAKCGDGFVRAGVEACDDGNTVANDTCLNNCTVARCGDSVACTAAGCNTGPGGAPEQCDDGNTNQNDPCLSTCKLATCGDGIQCTALTPRCTTGPEGGPEVCDDGNKTPGDGCNGECGQEFCGDSAVQPGLGEECDDGAENSNSQPDACRVNCKNPRCGDSVVDTGEVCDPPNGTTCAAGCQLSSCGNGNVDEGDDCDDGDANSDTTPDACRTTCVNPFCGDGVKDPSNSEACEDGNESNEDACRNDCKANVCGDGFRNPSAEQCDDGNTSNADACRNDCNNAVCGDGFVRSGVEECDDGNATETDRCRSNCKLATCGDGVTCSAVGCTSGPGGGAEECDAGAGNSNTTPNTCRTTCAAPGCGDNVIDSGEECDGTAGTCTGGGACASSCTCKNECPGSGELTVLAADGRHCTQDNECLAGSCIEGRCRTGSRLDTGLTGIAHGGDITDGVLARGFLDCGGSFPCGVCEITGIDPSTGTCRCANDNRKICDEPFTADADDCAGQTCDCYFGPPLAFSSGNTPACVVNRFSEDVSGTANVDVGEGSITTRLRSKVYLGEDLARPCPYCEGDPVENDGVRGGHCVLGPNDGQDCDSNGFNTTFPGPTGGGHSIDCFPSNGKNVSGAGLRIELTQSTGHHEMKISGDAICGFPPLIKIPCWCLQCTGDGSVSCTSNEECAALGLGTCTSAGVGDRPDAINTCDGTSKCVPVEGSDLFGECEVGPDDQFCDAYVRASGRGYVGCQSNADCDPGNIGLEAGACTLKERRQCFLDPIIADGNPDPSTPIGAAVFCIPPTGNDAIDGVGGFPGPGRVYTQARSKLFCASDPSKVFVPGVGGCE
jgi:cysteine-rich repeat protein